MPGEEKLAALLDGELPAAEARALREEIAADPDALREMAGQESLDRALRALLDERGHSIIKQAILADIAARPLAEAKTLLLRQSVPRHRETARVWKLAAAAAILLSAGLLLLSRIEPPPEPRSIAVEEPSPIPASSSPSPPRPPDLLRESAPPRVVKVSPPPAPLLPTPGVLIARSSPPPIPAAPPVAAATPTPPLLAAAAPQPPTQEPAWPDAGASLWTRPLTPGTRHSPLRWATVVRPLRAGLAAPTVAETGGVIRGDELRDGIPHALALSVPVAWLNGRGEAFVWPATSAPADARRTFGTRGNVHLGSLLTLPTSAKPDKYGVAREIARALRDYGGYIVATSDAGLRIHCAAPVSDPLMAELSALAADLRVVASHPPDPPAGKTDSSPQP